MLVNQPTMLCEHSKELLHKIPTSTVQSSVHKNKNQVCEHNVTGIVTPAKYRMILRFVSSDKLKMFCHKNYTDHHSLEYHTEKR